MSLEDASTRARRPDGNLGYLFRLGYQAFRRELARALAPHQLSVAQYGALSAFNAVPELSSAELARLTNVTPQTMNTLVHQLGEQGLLDQSPHPVHRRVVVLRLSRRGRQVLDRATPAVRAVEHEALDGLSTRDARVVAGWLAGLIDRLA